MATTYAEVADKLTKKLGELEETLKTSTEPTEIESAKRMTERVQQALQLLKISQQNHPEAESPEGQGMQQGMEQQMMPQQGGMPQGQPSPEEMAMMQQQQQMPMPQQQGMSPYQSGGYLPSYQNARHNLPMADIYANRTPQNVEDSLYNSTISSIEDSDMSTQDKNMYINTIDKVGDAVTPELAADPNTQKVLDYIENNPDSTLERIREMVPEGGYSEDKWMSQLGGMASMPGKIKALRKDMGLTRSNALDMMKKAGVGAITRTVMSPFLQKGGEVPWGEISQGALGAIGTAPIWRNMQQAGEPVTEYQPFTNPYTGYLQENMGRMGDLAGQAEEAIKTDRAYDTSPELVKAKQRYGAAMQNAENASGSARFALQNMASSRLASETGDIITKGRNIEQQWNNPMARGQALAGLGGLYGNMGRIGYGMGQDIGAERAKAFDWRERSEAARRAHGTQATMDLSEWAQVQQKRGNQKEMDQLSMEQQS